MKVFDETLDTLERALDARLLRQNVLAGNLANADTPGFVPKDVDFERAMESATQPVLAHAAATSAPGHLPLDAAGEQPPSLVGTVIDAPGASPGLDGNGVDVDRTMVALAKNGIQYGAAAKAAGKKLAILRYVASDGAA